MISENSDLDWGAETDEVYIDIEMDAAGQLAAEAELATAAAGILAQLPDWVLELDRVRDQQIAQARAAGERDRVVLLERHAPLIEDGGLVCAACVAEHDDYIDSLPTLDGVDLHDVEHLLFPCAVLRQAGWPEHGAGEAGAA